MESGKNSVDNSVRRIKTTVKDLISEKSTNKNFLYELYHSLLEISDLKEKINFQVLMVFKC